MLAAKGIGTIGPADGVQLNLAGCLAEVVATTLPDTSTREIVIEDDPEASHDATAASDAVETVGVGVCEPDGVVTLAAEPVVCEPVDGDGLLHEPMSVSTASVAKGLTSLGTLTSRH